MGVSSRCGLSWNTLAMCERRPTAIVSEIIVGTYPPSYLLFILPTPSAPDSVARVSSTPNPSHVVEKLRMILTDFQTQMESRKSEVGYTPSDEHFPLHLPSSPFFHFFLRTFYPPSPPLSPPSLFPFLSFLLLLLNLT